MKSLDELLGMRVDALELKADDLGMQFQGSLATLYHIYAVLDKLGFPLEQAKHFYDQRYAYLERNGMATYGRYEWQFSKELERMIEARNKGQEPHLRLVQSESETKS